MRTEASSPVYARLAFTKSAGGNGDWWVEYFDDDGGCYVTILSGPECEARARDYFHALKSKRLKTIRAVMRIGPTQKPKAVARRKARKK
jgi:hypothetical protein